MIDIVLLLTRGLAQNEILMIYPNVISIDSRAIRNPNVSAKEPTTTGPMAPPTIPEHRIPANEPWCLFTEFSPKDMIIENMTEIVNPISGKQNMEIFAVPNRLMHNKMIVRNPA